MLELSKMIISDTKKAHPGMSPVVHTKLKGVARGVSTSAKGHGHGRARAPHYDTSTGGYGHPQARAFCSWACLPLGYSATRLLGCISWRRHDGRRSLFSRPTSPRPCRPIPCHNANSTPSR